MIFLFVPTCCGRRDGCSLHSSVWEALLTPGEKLLCAAHCDIFKRPRPGADAEADGEVVATPEACQY